MSPAHRNRKERMMQITEAAMECFRVKGYVNTSVDDIAKASGLSKGSVYWYFKTKDDILLQAIREFTQIFKQTLSLIDQDVRSQADKLQAGFDLFSAFQEKNKGMFNMFVEFWAQSKDRDGVRAYWLDILNVFHEAVSKIVKGGIDNNEFKCKNPENLVWSIMATLDGLGGYSSFVDDLDIPSILDSYKVILLKGLRQEN